MGAFFQKILNKLTEGKSMFVIACLTIICTVPLSPTNLDAFKTLMYAWLGVKGVQYAGNAVAAAVKARNGS